MSDGTSAKTRSIRDFTLRHLWIILAFTCIGGIGLFFLVTLQLESAEEERRNNEHQLLEQHIAHILTFYESTISSLASQQQVVDLVNFSNTDEAESWARQMSSLLPMNIGLALVTIDGEVLGNPLQLRLGRLCLADIRQKLDGKPVSSNPPVHKEVDALAHYDIVQPVREGDEAIGVLFASFSLDVLQEELEHLASPGQYISLIDGNGKLIAEAGEKQLPDVSGSRESIGTLPGSDWRLVIWSAPVDTSSTLYSLFFTLGTIFIMTSIMILLLIYNLGRVVRKDLHHIYEQLQGIGKGFQVKPSAHGGLQETNEIMQEIAKQLGKVDQQQVSLRDQSNTDPLTGLYNRRGFQDKADYALHMASRGIPCALLLFDLDRFKECNDTQGHAMGDKVLQLFAELAREQMRDTDIAERLGGDEFAIVLINMEHASVSQWYEKLAQTFLQRQKEMEGLLVYCTLSCGAVTLLDRYCELDNVLQVADKELYQAKGLGRNTLSLHQKPISCADCAENGLTACKRGPESRKRHKK